MATDAIPQGTMTVEAFLDWDARQRGKHYLYRGRVYAMAGGSRNHGSITPALTEICRRQLRGRTCRHRDENTKVVVAKLGATFFPDGLVACPPNYVSVSGGAIDNPTVLFEVLSPGTEKLDREGKLDAYALLASLREYVLIHSEAVRVEVFTRQSDGSWNMRVYLPGTVARVESVGIELPLDELYEEAVFEEDGGAPQGATN